MALKRAAMAKPVSFSFRSGGAPVYPFQHAPRRPQDAPLYRDTIDFPGRDPWTGGTAQRWRRSHIYYRTMEEPMFVSDGFNGDPSGSRTVPPARIVLENSGWETMRKEVVRISNHVS